MAVVYVLVTGNSPKNIIWWCPKAVGGRPGYKISDYLSKTWIETINDNSLQLINNFRQDLLNKNLVEPSIDNGVHEMKHNQELMVREGDEKLWIINIEPQVLVILESSSQPEKDCDLLIFIHPKGNIY